MLHLVHLLEVLVRNRDGHGQVQVGGHALAGGLGGLAEGPVALNFVHDGEGVVIVHRVLLDQAVQQVGAAVLQVGAQGLIGQGRQVVPQEGAGKGGGVHDAQAGGEALGGGGGEVGAVLIAQGPEQEDGVGLGGAGVPGAEGGLGGAVGDAPVRQPGHVGGHGLVHIGEGAGDAPGLEGVLGLRLGSVEPDQHNGGLAPGGNLVQGEAVGGALEHTDGGQFFRRAVKVGGGGADAQGGGQSQGGQQGGEEAFHNSRVLLSFVEISEKYASPIIYPLREPVNRSGEKSLFSFVLKKAHKISPSSK